MQGDLFADEGFGGLEPSTAEAESAVGVDRSQDIVGGIYEWFNPGAEGSCAGLVAIGRHGQAEGIMGSMVVVALAPGIEGLLGLAEIVEDAAVEQLELEGAVEALVLAVALGMARRTVPRRHPMFDQPDAEPGEPAFAGVTPRRTVVGQHDLGQAIAFEGRLYGVLHGLAALV